MGGKKKSTDMILYFSLRNNTKKKERPVHGTSLILLEINYLPDGLIFGVEISPWFDECTFLGNEQIRDE